jgi:hypothetical protein
LNRALRKFSFHAAATSAVAIAAFGFAGAARADDGDARNFLTIATGSVADPGDPRIQVVRRQLDAITAACGGTSSGAGIHDKLGKGHSLMKTQQPLLQLLADFVRIAQAQCSAIDDTTLITIYVLERNAGAGHTATVNRVIANPKTLIAKWSRR